MNNSQDYSYFNSHVEKKCIHTKNVYALLDAPKKEDTYKKLNKHLESCRVCNEEFKQFQAKTLASQIYIPKAMMDHDLRQTFDRELDELFKMMSLNEREALKNNVKKSFNYIDQVTLAFIKNLGSRSMLKAYLAASALFLVLKFIF